MGSLQKAFEETLRCNEDLKAILVTDRDGVILIKAESPNLPPRVTKAALSATFSMASDQASKIGLGKTNMVMSVFDEYQIVQFSYAPLILSLIAPSSANSGLLLDIGTKFGPQINVLSNVVK
ncbi:Ragulator complex protein lamtor3 [Chytridiales sp. JEL 0842]|nr:Ragulator complex protein lamtor3 [Chytridiales sp. JEL 0842]